MTQHTKYIFVTGGVLSSLGKGLSAAALGAILEARGLQVSHLKMDPYINVDPGTMSPYQHGEVFVTDDGTESDLDLGHYERFTSTRMSAANNFTTGQVYQSVIERERQGEYLGSTVQVIPHITDEIKARIKNAAGDHDILIVEVGGTVGDIESLPFLEALRQFRADVGSSNALAIHVTLVPYVRTSGELKTKPTQHSVKELLNNGIQPDLLLCRSEQTLPLEIRKKISLFCNVPVEGVVSAPDVENIYELPLVFHDQGLDAYLLERFNFRTPAPRLQPWRELVSAMRSPQHQVRVGIVGKYVHLGDTYKSLHEALCHGAAAQDVRVDLVYLDSEELESDEGLLQRERLDAILVPGGFGLRGVEGKILAARYARTEQLPFLGICLGMQVAVIEFARHVLGLKDAHSVEFQAETPHPVVSWMPEQSAHLAKGGTMRLGAWECGLREGSLVQAVYQGAESIRERHRHRFEVNPDYSERLEQAGLHISGRSRPGDLVEIVELPGHPWYVACQYHPEFMSRPLEPHPLFHAFISAALKRRTESA